LFSVVAFGGLVILSFYSVDVSLNRKLPTATTLQ